MDPNVLVVVFDAARASNFSCYGHERPTTPTTDALADSGTLFRRAVSPSGVTFDSVTSLFSGRHPIEHKSGKVTEVNTSVPLLAEFLSDRGYRTAAATSSPSTTPAFGFGRGFDEFFDVTHQFKDGLHVRRFFDETKHLPARTRYAKFLRASLDRHFFSHLGNALRFKFGFIRSGDDGGRKVTNRSMEFIRDSATPWFLYVHYTETHMNSVDDVPYSLPGDRLFEFVSGSVDTEKLVTRSSEVDYDADIADVHERMYDAAIRYLDDLTGELVDTLADQGELENTIVVVTADHGEAIGEHGFLGHGRLYEPILHVPLVIRGPGIGDGERDTRVNTIGLYRTLAEIVDQAPDHVRGPNLLDSSTYEDAVLVQDYSDTWEWSRYGGKQSGQNALYLDGWKYVITAEGELLYRIEEDPSERTDLADERPAKRDELRSALTSQLDELSQADPESARHEFDETTERRLQELGYLE